MLIGPASTKAQIEEFRTVLKMNPAKYIAQPTLALSACPTFVEAGIAPRHIDLRPFVLSGQGVSMVPGGPDAGGIARGVAGGQLFSRWWVPRTPGCWSRDAEPHRRSPVLDGTLRRAR